MSRPTTRATLKHDAKPSPKAARRPDTGDALAPAAPAVRNGHKRKKGSKVHLAVDTLGHLLALQVSAAKEQERAQVGELADAVQEATGNHVEVAFVDQGYTGDEPAQAAQEHGMRLEVVKLPEAKEGFVLLPRRWVVERTFNWLLQSRRLSKDYERLCETSEALIYTTMTRLMARRLARR